MATESAQHSLEAGFRRGMIKRLSVISTQFLERLLKTCGPHDHDQWPPEPTIGPINPGILTKIAKTASEEYLDIMRDAGRDALKEFDARLLRQVLRNVVYQTLSVSRKSPRHTSPPRDGSAGGGATTTTAGSSQYTSPAATPRDYRGGDGAGIISPLPLGSITAAAASGGRLSGSVDTTMPGGSSARGRFMVLHPGKAEAMMQAKRMLDPLLQSSKFPREAYKAVVLDVGEQYMERFHPHQSAVQHYAGHTSAPGDYALTQAEREWITATVLSFISRIVVNDDGSISLNGRVVGFAPALGAGGSRGVSPGRAGSGNRGGGGHDTSFLKQLQRLRNILQQEESDQVPSLADDSGSSPPSGAAAAANTFASGAAATASAQRERQQQQQQQRSQTPPSRRSYRERVFTILQRYAPSKVSKTEEYLSKYPGREEELIAALVEKYCAAQGEPTDADVAAEAEKTQVGVPPVADRGASAASNDSSESKREHLERDIANMQYQMNQMQSQLAAAQRELVSIQQDDAAATAGAGAAAAASEPAE